MKKHTKKAILFAMAVAAVAVVVSGFGVDVAANERYGGTEAALPAPTPVDASFAARITAEHNVVRAKYDLPPLQWDRPLADRAQEWADKLALFAKLPPDHRDDASIGENIIWGGSGALTPQSVVARWAGEAANYNIATNTCADGKSCLHFTQVVWSTTTKVGCGKARTADGMTDFVVCDYSTPGNIGQQPPFKPTPPTTAQVKPSPTSTPTTGDVYLTGNPQITNFPVVPRVTPTPNTVCDVCSAVQQLAAKVDQLKPADGKTAPKNNVVPAKTTLLFPFVSNQAGFDTGISIANTSADTLGTKPVAGNCELSYFGNTTRGGAAPVNQRTTLALLGGQTLVFSLSRGGTDGIAGTPEFQGYIIATCNFPYARGYAFISDIGAQKLAQGYLAEILPDPRVP